MTSYWMDSTPATDYAALPTDLEVDVAVVGGGIAGISTAWELVRRGRTVAILEADRIVSGVTGNTTAKVTALHGQIYAKLKGQASLYARSQQDAIERIDATVAELGIDCDWERRAAYTYVTGDDGVPALKEEAAAARDAGLPASFVTETGLPFPVAGAVRVEDQAQFHPRRYLLAVAQAITAAGGCGPATSSSPPTTRSSIVRCCSRG